MAILMLRVLMSREVDEMPIDKMGKATGFSRFYSFLLVMEIMSLERAQACKLAEIHLWKEATYEEVATE